MIINASTSPKPAMTSKGEVTRNFNASEKTSTGLDHRLDFTNMSRKEFDSVWAQENNSTGLPPLVLPAEGLDLTKDVGAQMNAVYDRKIDFIAHFKSRLTFHESLPTSETNARMLDFYQSVLQQVDSLQGQNINPRLNVSA